MNAARTLNPRNLDIGAFIESGEALPGETAVVDLPRVAHGLSKEIDAAQLPAVTWSVQGRQVAQRVGGPQLWLDLSAKAELAWECQRCLHPVSETVNVDTSIRFVKDEAAAAALDADCDEDVLALSRHFDLIELIEDELIMAQPIVPRHQECPTDIGALLSAAAAVTPPEGAEPDAPGEEQGGASGKPNPFAVLAKLKKGQA